MNVKTVEYARLAVTRKFENQRVSVTIELDPTDDPDVAFDKAKQFVESKLEKTPKQEEDEPWYD